MYKIQILSILLFLTLSCKRDSDYEPIPIPEPIDPCKIIPGTNLYFGDFIYKFDSLGWPILITSNDTAGGLGSNYQLYRYGNGVMNYTETSLSDKSFWSFDSLNCSGSTCTHYYANSDSACNLISNTCSSSMELNIGNWVLQNGNTTYYYNNLLVLDSITYPNATFHFRYSSGRISKIYELSSTKDTLAVQTFTFNFEDQWREYYKLDHTNQHVEQIIYSYNTDGNLNAVSVGYGPQPITLADYSITIEGCGEQQRSLDPLNKYRLPHMRLKYIGLPW